MQDLYVLILGFGVLAFLTLTLFTLNHNPRKRAKDKHFNELITIKDDTIAELKRSTKGLRSKIQHLERGPIYTEDNEDVEDILSGVYDELPSYVKNFISRDEAKKFLDDPDRLKAIAQKFKQKVNKEDIQTLETL